MYCCGRKLKEMLEITIKTWRMLRHSFKLDRIGEKFLFSTHSLHNPKEQNQNLSEIDLFNLEL